MTEAPDAAQKIVTSMFNTARAEGVVVHTYKVDDHGKGWATVRMTIKPKEEKP